MNPSRAISKQRVGRIVNLLLPKQDLHSKACCAYNCALRLLASCSSRKHVAGPLRGFYVVERFTSGRRGHAATIKSCFICARAIIHPRTEELRRYSARLRSRRGSFHSSPLRSSSFVASFSLQSQDSTEVFPSSPLNNNKEFGVIGALPVSSEAHRTTKVDVSAVKFVVKRSEGINRCKSEKDFFVFINKKFHTPKGSEYRELHGTN